MLRVIQSPKSGQRAQSRHRIGPFWNLSAASMRIREAFPSADHLVPLMSEAAFKGDVPTMQRLVVKGASVNQHDQVSTPPSLPSPRRTPHCSLLPRAGLSHSPPCRVGLNWIGWV
jgi:hypothetical protein